MIKTPNGKNLMNLQEAVQWLLDNNALPFQCTADYIGGAEIGLGTIVNPTPAKVRVGSLIFFADSKVSTVIALTSNSFICSDEYNDLVDDIVYVSNVELNASGHLIVTLSNATQIDAGLIKQISYFSIDASQHLIAHYNDSTSTDLGAIFSGNVSISGNLSVSGTMTAQSLAQTAPNVSRTISLSTGLTYLTLTSIYCKALVINGELDFIISATAAENTGTSHTGMIDIVFAGVTLPTEVAEKIYDVNGNTVDQTLGASAMIAFSPIKLFNASTSTYFNGVLQFRNATIGNQINMTISADSAQNVGANDVIYISARTFLTLF